MSNLPKIFLCSVLMGAATNVALAQQPTIGIGEIAIFSGQQGLEIPLFFTQGEPPNVAEYFRIDVLLSTGVSYSGDPDQFSYFDCADYQNTGVECIYEPGLGSHGGFTILGGGLAGEIQLPSSGPLGRLPVNVETDVIGTLSLDVQVMACRDAQNDDLNCPAVDGMLVVAVSVGSVDLGSVNLAEMGPIHEATVANNSGAAIDATAFSLGGPNADDFQVSIGSCASTLADGNSCALDVVCAPSVTGNLTASLSVSGASAHLYCSADTGVSTVAELPELAVVSASDAEMGDDFAHAVAVYGDLLVVGAPGYDDAPTCAPCEDSGAVYVFANIGDGQWTEASILTASDAQASSGFGESVAIYGNTVVVGAPAVDTVYVFEPADGAGWTESILRSDFPAPRFGTSLAIWDESIAVGAMSGTFLTHFGWSATSESWVPMADWSESDFDDGVVLGMHRRLVAMGAPFFDAGDPPVADSGSILVLGNGVSTYMLYHRTRLITETPLENAHLGTGVDIENDLIVASAPGNVLGTIHSFRLEAEFSYSTPRWVSYPVLEDVPGVGFVALIRERLVIPGQMGRVFQLGPDNTWAEEGTLGRTGSVIASDTTSVVIGDVQDQEVYIFQMLSRSGFESEQTWRLPYVY